MTISSDKDQIVIEGPYEIYRNENAKLIVDIYNFDSKTGKEIYINTIEFPFENNPNLGGDDSGNNDDNNGDNNDGDLDDEKYRGFINGHEWVDLGLPSGTKWATMNIGASSEYEVGKYFMWANTTDEDNYILHPLYQNDRFVRYNGRDGNKHLLSEDDAATVNWGNLWGMPTQDQFKELYKYCKFEKVTKGTMTCYRLIGPNSQSMIIPFGGIRDFWEIEYFNIGCSLWTNENGNDEFSAMAFQSGIAYDVSYIEEYSKFRGCNVRAVVKLQ